MRGENDKDRDTIKLIGLWIENGWKYLNRYEWSKDEMQMKRWRINYLLSLIFEFKAEYNKNRILINKKRIPKKNRGVGSLPSASFIHHDQLNTGLVRQPSVSVSLNRDSIDLLGILILSLDSCIT